MNKPTRLDIYKPHHHCTYDGETVLKTAILSRIVGDADMSIGDKESEILTKLGVMPEMERDLVVDMLQMQLDTRTEIHKLAEELFVTEQQENDDSNIVTFPGPVDKEAEIETNVEKIHHLCKRTIAFCADEVEVAGNEMPVHFVEEEEKEPSSSRWSKIKAFFQNFGRR